MARSFSLHARASGTDDPFTTERLLNAFHQHYNGSPQADPEDLFVARAPGRVNLIGDHTDYNDGFALPATIDRAAYVVLRPRTDQTIRLHSLNFEEDVEYPLSNPPIASLPTWARYVAGVGQEIRDREDIATGFEGIIYGNVPLGSGLSSSAALEVAVAVALDALFALNLDPVETAKLCQAVEHKYVGVQCGIMDQMASRLGKGGHALSLDCRSLDYKHVPLPLDEANVVIADTRVSRELASSKYNERRAECEEAVAFFQQIDREIKALRDVTPTLLNEVGDRLPEPINRRSRHVVTENERVLKSAKLLEQGRVEAFGRLMNTSHESLRDDYEVSCDELNLLVETAQETNGVLGARMTGAGFGGCAVCLVTQDAIPTLRSRLINRYTNRFGRRPTLYTVQKNLESTSLQP